MKKMLICFALFIILLSGAENKRSFSLCDYYSGYYVSYSNTPLNNNSIYTGSCYINTEKTNLSNTIGECITINDFEPASALKELKARVVKTEYLETGATVIYAYSNLIPRSVCVENEKVNLQIAYYETHSVVGWPLILGGF